MTPLTTEDHQRLTDQVEDLQIELGYLRQVAGSLLERVHVVGAQLTTITDILERHGGHRAPPEPE